MPISLSSSKNSLLSVQAQVIRSDVCAQICPLRKGSISGGNCCSGAVLSSPPRLVLPLRLAPASHFLSRAEVALCHPPIAVEMTATTTPNNYSSGGYSEDEPFQGPASHAAQSSASTDKMLSHLGITPKIAPACDGPLCGLNMSSSSTIGATLARWTKRTEDRL